VLWRGVDATPPRLISRDGTAVLHSSNMGLCWNQVRIDPNATVAGHPALVIRRSLRRLRGRLSWGLADLEAAAALNPGEGNALAKALRAARLIEGAGRGAWVITQAGQTFSSATAAKPITRMTAERALAEFLERVRRVERDPYFLAKVTRVVLFGSMLNPEVQRLSDVDVAVELTAKETDYDLARALSRRRVEELARQGRQFRNFLEMEHCWHRETFQFLKSRSRVIALADYAAEKPFILAVPHRVLIGTPEQPAAENPATPTPSLRSRRPRELPF
jgi:predicted nucleotidyltransferase